MISRQSVDDLRVIEYEAENAMVVKPSGYIEFRAYCSHRFALVRFAAEAGESTKRIDHLVEGRTLTNDTMVCIAQSVTQAGDEEEMGE
jgi:hypothetical protein